MLSFIFYELESQRLLLWRSIRFGMREARKRNCGSKQCCCSPALPPQSQFRRPSGEKTHLEKAVKFIRMPSQAPTIRTQKEAFGPTRKREGGSLPTPTHNFACSLLSFPHLKQRFLTILVSACPSVSCRNPKKIAVAKKFCQLLWFLVCTSDSSSMCSTSHPDVSKIIYVENKY